MVDTALDLFKRRQTAGRATVLVFYRGERSFFCKQWLRRWLSIPGFDRRLDLADVFLLFISSQSQGKAYSVADQIAGKKAILDTRVFFFGDPEHLLVDYLAESGLAHPVVTNPDSHRAHGWVFDYGMVQPAVLAIAADASILYEWTSKPSLLNVAGKLDRPDPWDVWDKIEQRIDRIRITKARAARRAMATASSAVSSVKEGSTISSEGQSQPNPPDAYSGRATPARSASKDPNLPNATQLSLKSLQSSQQRPTPQREAPVSSESTEKEPKSAEENRQDETKSTLTPRQLGEGDSSANETFSSAGGERILRKSASDGETTTAPPSTAIETLTVDTLTLKTPLSQEERDSSEDEMSSIRVQQLSVSINALASEVLAEKNMSLAEPEPETVAKLPKLAEEVVMSQHQAECLTDEEHELEVEGNAAENHKDVRQDDHDPVDLVGTVTKDNTSQDTDPPEDVGRTTGAQVKKHTDQHTVRFTEEVEMQPVAEAQSATKVTSAALTVTPIIQDITVKEDVADNAEVINMHMGTYDDALEFAATTSKEASASISLEASRNSEMFDVHDSVGDTLEASVASLGSDQVDSTAVIVKHPSVRVEDSSQVNSLAGFEVSSFPSERRIPEEADDKKTGISDYLKDLKDPSMLKDPRYRSRYDPLPLIKPIERRPVPSSSNSRPRPTSVSGYSHAGNTNIDSNAGLARGLIQQETGMSPEATHRDISRRGRETRISQRTVPPVAVYVAEMEPDTPPHVAKIPLSGQSQQPMTASPHPEIHNLTRAGTVDISPFVDANHEMTMPEDLGTKSSLPDEYEAYDEYIVCEYEVEEYVEEYESDPFSRSKIFVTTVVDDSSQDENTPTVSDEHTLNEVHHFDHCNVVDVKGTAREPGVEGRVRVWKESGARSTAAVSPTVEANMMHRQNGVQSMSPVQVLLRKMGVRGPRRTRASEEAASEEIVPTPARDPSRISRKDTIRSVLRKTPRERVPPGELEEAVEPDEVEARLGRKETIKSVLRKIPVPKNLKRAQTEVAIDGDEERSATPVQDTGARSSRRSGLQAVLQRLPSLSSANRHRGGVKVETMSVVTSTNEIGEANVCEMEHDQKSDEGGRGASSMTREVEGDKPGVLKRTLSRLAKGEEPDKASGTGAGAIAGASGALDERRKVRWGKDGERVGGKVSFAVVGGRILSKFRM